MEPKILKNTFKKKLQNHMTKKGNKWTSEKGFDGGIKQTQKSQKKNSNKLVKRAVFDVIPTFRIIKLTDKRRKKKSLNKEIPGFLSNKAHRLSWGLKHLVKTSTKKDTTGENFALKLKNTFLAAQEEGNNTIEIKNDSQSKALENKKFFRYYKW